MQNHPFPLRDRLRFTALLALLLMLSGCAGTRRGGQGEVPAYATVSVMVASENLRDAPLGDKIDKAVKGESFSLIQRRGNWCEISNESQPDAWIWAPSIGIARINPLDLALWTGGKTATQSADELTDLFGQQTDVRTVNSETVVYEYDNAMSLFGINEFNRAEAWIDRATKSVVRVTFDLPPFTGSRPSLLKKLGLPSAKASSTDFDKSVYDGISPNAGRVEMRFVKGNFKQIATVTVDRYNPGLVASWVSITGKKLTIEGDVLTLELTMKNRSTAYAFTSPRMRVELVQGSRNLGSYTLGPGNVRIEPGQEATFRMPTPVKAATVDVKQVAWRPELIDMLVVPPTGGTTL